MANLMYALSAPVFVRMLGNLSGVLAKGAAHAEARKIDPAVLVNARLYPDMLPLSAQVQIAGDHAKGAAARLTGNDPPKYDDNERGFDDLQARLARTIAYVEGFKPEQFDGSDERTIMLPNFYFHVTTAYDILRHNGVEIGKRDFTGPIAS
jgi:hypothetical protein